MSPACNPAWLGILAALLTPLIALIVAYIAYRQWKTAQNRLRLDLFDKRLAIHSAARDLIATVTSYGKIENRDMFAFLSGIQGTRWLFNESIVQYFEQQLWQKVTKLQELLVTLDSPSEDRTSNIHQRRELTEWIAGQRPNLDAQFDKFLKVPDPALTNRAVARRSDFQEMPLMRQKSKLPPVEKHDRLISRSTAQTP